MLRLSRPSVCLLTLAGVLSALAECERCAEECDASLLAGGIVRLAPWLSERRRQLDSRLAVAAARSRQIDALSGEVAAGRVSLLDGAARLRDLLCSLPD